MELAWYAVGRFWFFKPNPTQPFITTLPTSSIHYNSIPEADETNLSPPNRFISSVGNGNMPPQISHKYFDLIIIVISYNNSNCETLEDA